MTERITIAIDGPAGAGKSTIAKMVAKELKINYIDTGAMYRALTYKIITREIDENDIDRVVDILKETDIDFKEDHIVLDGTNVDEEIRTTEVTKKVSDVAKIKEVREKLVELQRKIAGNKSVIMDGRDIASHVLPNAKYKFFLSASAEERGMRRYKEMLEKGQEAVLEDVISDIVRRDEIDSNREFAPLVKVEDAIEINTTKMTIEDVLSEIKAHVLKG